MKKVHVQFGSGWLAPKMTQHLVDDKKTQEKQQEAKQPKAEMGAGWLAPKLEAHLSRKADFGSGWLSPALKAHLRRA